LLTENHHLTVRYEDEMKLKWKIGIATACVGVSLAVILQTRLAQAAIMTRTFLPFSAKVIEYSDDHGGFHGDGTTRMTVKLDKRQTEILRKRIRERNDWHELPTKGDVCDAMARIEPASARHVQQGFCYFRDLQQARNNTTIPGPDTPFSRRYSFNFVVAVFDTDGQVLYIYNLDT
jgi:hypothetical protein